MKKIFQFQALLLLFLLFGISTTKAQKSNYERLPGYWTLGINGGLAYQQSDVPLQLKGGGLGLTLAKNLYYQPGAPFAFDLRGRALYAQSFGLDADRNYDITDNEALNGSDKVDYTKFATEDSYVFNNNKTHLGELSLEGVIHLNKLRENTRFDLSLYGGIGAGWYLTKLDQLNDATQAEYDYTVVDETASNSNIKKNLKNQILDGKYETLGTGMNDWGKIGFMPSAGFDLEYQLSPRFSIGAGHKITFTGSDNFDGQIGNENNSFSTNNDWHHFTNLSLRWIIDPSNGRTAGPDVDFVNPHQERTIASTSDGFVRARIKNVESAMDVELIVNGKSIPFQYADGILKSHFQLLQGSNNVTLSAINANGSDSESAIIIYNPSDKNPVLIQDDIQSNPPQQYEDDNDNQETENDDDFFEDKTKDEYLPYPDVDITRPRRVGEEWENSYYTFEARVQHVDYKNDILLKLNGRRISNFSFTNNRVKANLRLKEGRNDIFIEVQNARGARSADSYLYYDAFVANRNFEVEITQPYKDPFTTYESRERIEAQIRGVEDDGCNILFKVNGRSSNDYRLNGSSFTGTASLRKGKNTVEVVAVADGITKRDRTIIYYEEMEKAMPEVNITSPSRNYSTTYDNKVEIVARTQNVDRKSDVDFIINGRNSSDFNFRNGRFTAQVNLKAGNNQIEIEVRNEQGRDRDRREVVREERIEKPRVEIVTPHFKSNLTDRTTRFEGRVRNVSDKQDVQLKVNGKRITSFDFRGGKVTTTLNLRYGKNQLELSATNAAGTDTDRGTITVTKVKPLSKPNVTITSPKKSGTKTTNAKLSFTAKTRDVQRKSDVQLWLNGKKIAFTFDAKNQKIRANTRLKKGENIFKITVANSSGRDSDEKSITYNRGSISSPDDDENISKPSFKKPVIQTLQMSVPAIDPLSPNSGHTRISAQLMNVQSKSEIKLTLNGTRIQDFDFNSKTGSLSVVKAINRGRHTVVLIIKTKGGNARQQTQMTF